MATEWNIETSENGTLSTNGVLLEDGNPTLRVGDEATLTFFFEGANHLSRYESVMDYVEYTTDSTVDYGSDVEGQTWYRQTPHPNSPVSDYLVKLVPDSSINGQDPVWAVIYGGEDNSLLVGAGERVTLEVYVLAKAANYTRTEVENQIKAEL